MKDKIIQITDTLNDSDEGATYGLGESGKLYQFMSDWKHHPEAHPATGKANWHEQVNKRWELVVESPEKDTHAE